MRLPRKRPIQESAVASPHTCDRVTPGLCWSRWLALEQGPSVLVDCGEDQPETDEFFSRPLYFIGICPHLVC